jgi:hypothetical protein
MVITQELFDKEFEKLAKDNNLVIGKLLKEVGSYNKLSPNIKRLIDKKLGITRKIIVVMESDHPIFTRPDIIKEVLKD